MHKLFTLICVTLIVRSAYTAVERLSPVEKPEKFASEEGCYNPVLNIVLPYSVTYSPQDGKSCKGYLCQTNGWTQIFTCGAKAIAPGCREVPGDLTKPYPDCCNDFTCDSQTNATA